MTATTIGRSSGATPLGGTRTQPLAITIIVLVFGMVAIMVTGFAFINAQQHTLIDLREDGRQVRVVEEALRAADAGVLHLIIENRGEELNAYYRAMDVLRERRDTTLTLLDPLLASGTTSRRPSADIIDKLEATWTQAIAFVTSGQHGAAQRLLSERGTGADVALLGDAFEDFLLQWDAQFPIYEGRIGAGTLLVMLLQIGTGTLAVWALVFAFRSSAADASGRAAAMASANASREQVAHLFDMADVLQSASDHTDANAVLKATASELVPGFSGALYVFNNSRDRLVLSTSWHGADDRSLPETIAPNHCWALKRGKQHISRPNGEKLCCEHHSGDDTVLEIPMIARGEILGLLQLHASGADAEARLLQVATMGSALADGMSLALANIALREKLRNQALRDALTGLYNRRYMEDTLQRFVRLAERESREISVIMIDLDHFKRLNDEHGHALGDAVLRDTASAIVGSLRETDVACRYGGEELIVLLPDCDLEKAAEKAETIRLRIEALSTTHGAEISASFGVASIPMTSTTTAELVAASDTALYKAKQAGRNRVALAPRRPIRADKPQQAVSTVAFVAMEAAE